jgi:Tol biopolymer transport system component
MGEVYRAHDPRLNRTVAIKILPTSHLDHARRRRRFEIEQHALAALNHPNIVAVYDAGYQDERPFIVTECLDGQTLRDKLESPLSMATVLDYATQIARGLAAAHDRGILHRDLKPENVFVTVDGHIKLLDFGLARVADDDQTVTETSTFDEIEDGAVGTVGYMSPEQVLGTTIDHRADIFAFGIVLFEMLCGRRLFQRLSRIDALHAIVHDELPEAIGLDPRVPSYVASVLRRCLEKDPAQRFQSASDLAFALAGQARSTLETKPRSRRLMAAIATGAVLCGAVAASLLLPRAAAPSPSFKRLTFGRGNHGYARFAPDRTTVVYSAWWQGDGARLFSTRLDSSESRSLDLANADILSISRTGQMAVLLNPTNAPPSGRVGTLGVVPLAGGAPRPVLEDVQGADWSPDGKDLAVVRRVADQWRLEYPSGHLLYAGDFIFSARVSPRGDRIAFIEEVGAKSSERILTRQVCVVDRAGHKETLASGLPNTLAWSPDGTRIWFADTALHVVDLAGRSRTVLSLPEPAWAHVQDVGRDGEVLLVLANYEVGVIAHPRGTARGRDLSGFGNTEGAALSVDGSRLLFSEISSRWTRRPSGVYIRSLDGTPSARLGDGRAVSLSPDGRWAFARMQTPPFELKFYPTGPGEPRSVKTGSVEYLDGGSWSPDSHEVLILGRAAGGAVRVYAVPLDGGPPRPVTPEGVSALGAVSPDGRQVAVLDAARRLILYRVSDGDAVPVPGPPETAALGPWTSDGHAIFVADAAGGTAVRLFKRNITTGAREFWREIEPPDPAGIFAMRLLITPDGETWAYTYQRFLSNLYTVSGLK